MDVVRRIRSMKQIARQAKAAGRRVGFVPTMGSLHEGHLSLFRRVREASDLLVVSNFVNPTQFGANEDLDRYPRDLARDADLCIREGVDVMSAPEVSEMYPTGACTWVEVEGVSSRLEGASRPGHFRERTDDDQTNPRPPPVPENAGIRHRSSGRSALRHPRRSL